MEAFATFVVDEKDASQQNASRVERRTNGLDEDVASVQIGCCAFRFGFPTFGLKKRAFPC